MIRRWLSNYLKNHSRALFILAMLIFVVMVYLLVMSAITPSDSDTNKEKQEVYKPAETVISGNDVSKEKLAKDEDVVTQFVDYCNKKEYKNAYEMLTDDCKNAVYPNINKFKSGYVDTIFNTYKDYNLQAWVNEKDKTIYKIRYVEDALATGNYSDTERFIDYITIVTDGDNKKISVSKFIENEEINETKETDQFKITVKSKDVFLEKESYKVSVENKTDKTVLIDSQVTTRSSIYLIFENGKANRANIYKLKSTDIEIRAGFSKALELEFTKNYDSDNYAEAIRFNDIILDKDEYEKNKDEYENRIKLEIDL